MTEATKLEASGSDSFERRRRPIGRLLFWLRSLVIQEVPGNMAHCEFGCRQGECGREQWESCGNRIDTARR